MPHSEQFYILTKMPTDDTEHFHKCIFKKFALYLIQNQLEIFKVFIEWNTKYFSFLSFNEIALIGNSTCTWKDLEMYP
jgi:5'(3')-deoxyribonucleotidase